jgi:hypothetical protein
MTAAKAVRHAMIRVRGRSAAVALAPGAWLGEHDGPVGEGNTDPSLSAPASG